MKEKTLKKTIGAKLLGAWLMLSDRRIIEIKIVYTCYGYEIKCYNRSLRMIKKVTKEVLTWI